MNIQNLRQRLIEQKNKVGLVSGSVKILEYDETKHNVAAHIAPQGWNIEVSLRKGFNPIQDRRQKAYARKKGITDGLETLVCHVGGLHEPAHWELPLGSGAGCPYNVYNHDLILEAVKNVLPQNKKSLADYVTNAFEDMIINPRCREFNGDFSGQVLFWDWEGIECSKKRKKPGFTPFYEAFVKLNMHLWGDNVDNALLKRHYTKDAKVRKAVESVINDLGLPANIPNTKQLFVKTSWSAMAATFTRNMLPLLDEMPNERLSAFSQEGQDSGSKEEQSAGNGVAQKIETRDGKEEVAYGRYSSGKSLSPNIPRFDQLDSLYRKLAQDIPVKVESMNRAQGLSIGPLTHRPFDADKDDPLKASVKKIYITDEGVNLGYPKEPLTVTSRFKMQRRSFPDFKIIQIDNSGSMREAIDGSNNVGDVSCIPWGNNSKYHFALLGFYGIEGFLQNQGIAQYIQHGVSLFSSSTRYKQGGFDQLADIRKLALSPDWGSTNLDASALRQALEGRESFVLSLSDGEIGNWGSERAQFRELLEKQYYAHIQIGGKTQFTQDLEDWKKPVFYVTNGNDLSHLMVDITRNTYRRFTKQ